MALLLVLFALLPVQARGEGKSGKTGPPVVTPVTAGELLRLVKERGDRLVMVNIWATWCRPCVEEFPDLLRLERSLRTQGVSFLLVSADFPSERPAVEAFLDRQGVNFESYLKQQDDNDFIEAMHPSWSGALPASFLFDSRGALADFWVGRVDYESMKKKIARALERSADSVSTADSGWEAGLETGRMEDIR